MLEKLLDILLGVWDFFIPFTVVREFEGGVILRFGKYKRSLLPGFHWFWPFGIEEVLTTETAITTIELRAQTLTTLDNQTIVISSIVKYQVKDPKPYLLEVCDAQDVLSDVTLGINKKIVNTTTYANLLDENIENIVLKAVRNEVNQFGFKVFAVTFVDMGKIKSLRLITDSGGFADDV